MAKRITAVILALLAIHPVLALASLGTNHCLCQKGAVSATPACPCHPDKPCGIQKNIVAENAEWLPSNPPRLSLDLAAFHLSLRPPAKVPFLLPKTKCVSRPPTRLLFIRHRALLI